MKYKNILATVGLLFCMYFIACLLGPKTVDIKESIDINAPDILVYNMIRDLKKWEKWSYISSTNPTLQFQYRDSEATKNGLSQWVGKNESGKLKILDLHRGRYVKLEAQDNKQDPYTMQLDITPVGATSRLTWSLFAGEISFLQRGYALFNHRDNNYSRDFIYGLSNIKRLVEERWIDKKYNDFTFELMSLPIRSFHEIKDPSWNEQNILDNVYPKYDSIIRLFSDVSNESRDTLLFAYYGIDIKTASMQVSSLFMAVNPMKDNPAYLTMDSSVAVSIIINPKDNTSISDLFYSLDELSDDLNLKMSYPYLEKKLVHKFNANNPLDFRSRFYFPLK